MKDKIFSLLWTALLSFGFVSSVPAQYFGLETPKIYSPGEKVVVNLSSQGVSGSIFIRLEEGFLLAKLCYGRDKNVARAVFPKGAETITINLENEVGVSLELTIEKTKDGKVRIKYYSSGC